MNDVKFRYQLGVYLRRKNGRKNIRRYIVFMVIFVGLIEEVKNE